MIAALTGELADVTETRAHVRCGPMVYELLVPAADVEALQARVGQEITFHTLMYLEGDPNRGNLEPRLLGFLRPNDKAFFELFTTVKGIGPKTALRALTVPVADIAHAIETRDARYLVRLDGIGKRTAELIVAELAGKAQKFVTPGISVEPTAARTRFDAADEEAISLIVSGGDRRADAEQLLARVKAANPNLKTAPELWQAMLRLRG